MKNLNGYFKYFSRIILAFLVLIHLMACSDLEYDTIDLEINKCITESKLDISSSWKYKLKNNHHFVVPPMLIGKNIYISSNNTTLVAIDMQKNMQEWIFNTKKRIVSKPYIIGGEIYIADSNYVYILNSKTGHLIRQSKAIQAEITTHSIITKGFLYFSSRGVFYVYDITKDRMLWHYDLSYGTSLATYVLQDGKIYLIDRDKLYAFDAMTGNVEWEQHFNNSESYTYPIVHNKMIYFGHGKSVWAVNSQDGKRIWKSHINESFYFSQPVLSKNKIFVGSSLGNLYVLDKKTGDFSWNFSISEGVFYEMSQPTISVSDNRLYYTNNGQNIYQLDQDKGCVVASLDFKKNIDHMISINDGGVIVSDRSGMVQRFSRSNNNKVNTLIAADKQQTLSIAESFFSIKQYDKLPDILLLLTQIDDIDAIKLLLDVATITNEKNIDYAKYFYLYYKLSELGDATAQNYIAVLYRDGKGIDKNVEKALFWFKIAAKKNDLNALNNLGMMYHADYGIGKDQKKSANYFLQAAQKNHAVAQHNLAILLLTDNKKSKKSKKNKKKAKEWLEKSANNGFADAWNTIGYIYGNGLGVKKDDKKADQYYLKAAKNGSVLGQVNMGIKLYEAERYRDALHWFKQAESSGIPYVFLYLGQMLEFGKGVSMDKSTAFQYYRYVANLQSSRTWDRRDVIRFRTDEWVIAEAQYHLARSYLEGVGTKVNYPEALNWFNKAQANGSIMANTQIGHIYKNGLGVVKNLEKAVEYYIQAAQNGDVMGQYQLGDAFLHGTGITKNYQKAYHWFKKASDKGLPRAMNDLGFLYADGKGVNRNASKALKLFLQAAKQGNHTAINNSCILYHAGDELVRSRKKAKFWCDKAANEVNTDFARQALKEIKQQELQSNLQKGQDFPVIMHKQNNDPIENGSEKSNTQDYILFGAGVGLRESPKSDAKKIHFLRFGATISKLKELAGWIQVKTEQGKSGWIKKHLVRPRLSDDLDFYLTLIEEKHTSSLGNFGNLVEVVNFIEIIAQRFPVNDDVKVLRERIIHSSKKAIPKKQRHLLMYRKWLDQYKD